MSRRILWHIGFWLSYSLVYALLNTAFAAPSDLAYSWPIRFLRFWMSELILLPIKITTAYLFIYWLVPRFLLKRVYWKMAMGSVGSKTLARHMARQNGESWVSLGFSSSQCS